MGRLFGERDDEEEPPAPPRRCRSTKKGKRGSMFIDNEVEHDDEDSDEVRKIRVS